MAGKIPSSAKVLITVRCKSRLLEYPAIKVCEWYAPIARQWLAAQYRHLGEIRLIVDGTKIGFGHQLLIVRLTYRKRAIPIAWTWVRHVKGHSPIRQQLALLCYVYTPCSLLDLPFSSLEIANLGLWRSCATWTGGIGSMSCVRKPGRGFGSMNKVVRGHLVVSSIDLVTAFGWTMSA